MNGAGDVTVSVTVRSDNGDNGSARVSITYAKGDALADMLRAGMATAGK